MSLRRPQGGRRGESSRAGPGGGGIGTPAAANVPTLSAANATQSSGTYVVGDDVAFTATTSDTDGHITTGVNLYESGVLVAAMVQFPAGTWVYTVLAVTVGSKSYVARRVYGGGSVDSAASTLTVVASMTPSDVAAPHAVSAWWRTPEALNIGNTPLHTAGTGTNVVTLSGTLGPNQPPGFHITFPVGGARGTATYSVSLDNGTTQFQTGTTAATVNVTGGTINGTITINFPTTSNYFANDVYKAVTNTLTSSVTGTDILTNGTSPQRPIPTAGLLGGFTAVRYDGSDDRHNCTTTHANTIAGGTNTAFSVVFVCLIRAMPAGGVNACLFCYRNTGSNASGLELRIKGGTTCVWTAHRRDDSAAALTIDSAIPATLGFHVLVARFDGTNFSLRDNSVDVIGGASEVSGVGLATAGASTLNNLAVGAEVANGSTTSFVSMDFYDMSDYPGYLPDVDVVRLERGF